MARLKSEFGGRVQDQGQEDELERQVTRMEIKVNEENKEDVLKGLVG